VEKRKRKPKVLRREGARSERFRLGLRHQTRTYPRVREHRLFEERCDISRTATPVRPITLEMITSTATAASSASQPATAATAASEPAAAPVIASSSSSSPAASASSAAPPATIRIISAVGIASASTTAAKKLLWMLLVLLLLRRVYAHAFAIGLHVLLRKRGRHSHKGEAGRWWKEPRRKRRPSCFHLWRERRGWEEKGEGEEEKEGWEEDGNLGQQQRNGPGNIGANEMSRSLLERMLLKSNWLVVGDVTNKQKPAWRVLQRLQTHGKVRGCQWRAFAHLKWNLS
jgi:hypothetical protein